MVDLLALATNHEGERASYPLVERAAHDVLVTQRRSEHPSANHLWIEPGVEDALWRRVTRTATGDLDSS
jgi:hypothetical protein